MKTMIIVNDGLEECEALIVYDLLYRAGIDVKLVGFTDTVVSSHNVTFKSDLLIDDVDTSEYECLILPGGMPGTKHLKEDKRVSDLIDEFVKDNKWVCAICAAPSILLEKGLLRNEKFTCFPGFEGEYTPCSNKAVQDGKFITGKGMGAAFEFSALIIENLLGKEKAKEVLSKVQY